MKRYQAIGKGSKFEMWFGAATKPPSFGRCSQPVHRFVVKRNMNGRTIAATTT